MKFVALPGFQRGFDRVPKHLQEKVWHQLETFAEQVGSPVRPKSLRFKKLPQGNFEISIDMDLRMLFQLRGDAIVLTLLGDHEDVRRYLRR